MLWQIKKEITASKINYAKTDRVRESYIFSLPYLYKLQMKKNPI